MTKRLELLGIVAGGVVLVVLSTAALIEARYFLGISLMALGLGPSLLWWRRSKGARGGQADPQRQLGVSAFGCAVLTFLFAVVGLSSNSDAAGLAIAASIMTAGMAGFLAYLAIKSRRHSSPD